jgi:hypothetical protein
MMHPKYLDILVGLLIIFLCLFMTNIFLALCLIAMGGEWLPPLIIGIL